MKTKLIAEHTIACLPKSSGMVLDVGCRHFDFSKAMLDKGYSVVSIEADDEVIPPEYENLRFGNYAVVATSQNNLLQTLVKFGNGTANHLSTVVGENPRDSALNQVLGLSITEISHLFKVVCWDTVKLDCEGAEYGILLEWPGPIAKQITVEFHEHTGANVFGPSVYDKIFEHLSQWYTVVQHESSVRHCLSTPNYWDTLFVIKDKIGND